MSFFIPDSFNRDEENGEEKEVGLVGALSLLENQGRSHLGVANFEVGRATLEQVFMALVREQEEKGMEEVEDGHSQSM